MQQRLGRYERLERIASGGQGTVYRARDTVLDRIVAVKVLNQSVADDPRYLEALQREARLAAGLVHPNITAVHDFQVEDETAYIVMEYVPDTLSNYLRDGHPLPYQRAVELAIQICRGLSHAHAQEIIHRDIKPANILLDSNGEVKISDFGIARALTSSTRSSATNTIGTPYYTPPEQWGGARVDAKSDIYSLGILLYEMLTGSVPFNGDSYAAIFVQHLNDPIPDIPVELGIPDSLANLVRIALEKEPEARFNTAESMSDALQMVLINSSAQEQSPSPRNEPHTDSTSSQIPAQTTPTRPPDINKGGYPRRLIFGGVVGSILITILIGAVISLTSIMGSASSDRELVTPASITTPAPMPTRTSSPTSTSEPVLTPLSTSTQSPVKPLILSNVSAPTSPQTSNSTNASTSINLQGTTPPPISEINSELQQYRNEAKAGYDPMECVQLGPQLFASKYSNLKPNQRIVIWGTCLISDKSSPTIDMTIDGSWISSDRINDGQGISIEPDGFWVAYLDIPVLPTTWNWGSRNLETRVNGDSLIHSSINLDFPERKLDVTPKESMAGSMINITGHNFPAQNKIGYPVKVTMAGWKATVIPDQDGYFDVRLKVPVTRDIPAERRIYATFNDDSSPVKLIYTVTKHLTVISRDGFLPVIVLDKYGGHAGDTVEVKASGFKRKNGLSQVLFEPFNVTPYPRISTDDNGRITFDITIPDLDPGLYPFKVSIGNHHRSVDFHICRIEQLYDAANSTCINKR